MSKRSYSRTAGQQGDTRWLIALFLAIVFFLSYHDLYYSATGADAYNQSNLVAAVDDGSLTRRIAFLCMGIFAIGSLLWSGGTRLRLRSALAWPLLFFGAWSALSLVWAEDLSLTLRRLIAFTILCLTAGAVARRFSLRDIVMLTFFWSSLFLVIGLGAEIFLGTFHPLAAGYRFSGTQHPNSQGINCALLLLSGIAAGDIEKRRWVLFRTGGMVGLAFLILTGSRTAFAAAVASLVVYWVLTAGSLLKFAIPVGLSGVFCLVLLVPSEALIPTVRKAFMLGRGDAEADTFEGRTGIWEDAVYYAGQRPIGGYGYGGFWTERHITDISAEENWPLDSAHSAYLECLLDLGIVGLAAFALAFLGGIGRSITLHRRTHAAVFAFAGALLVFATINGFMEAIVMTPAFLAFLSIVVLSRLAFATEQTRITNVRAL